MFVNIYVDKFIMDLFKQFESDQKMLNELKSLFEFVSPLNFGEALTIFYSHISPQKIRSFQISRIYYLEFTIS